LLTSCSKEPQNSGSLELTIDGKKIFQEKVMPKEKISEKHDVNKLIIEAPLWVVETYSPPFTNAFSKDQNDIIINNINKFKPDILFIGMTAPKQEKWVDINKNNLDAKYIISIGAVFDFYSDVKKSAPKLIVNLNLIWAYRLLTDFKHVWRRTFISFPLFLYLNVIKSIKIIR
jgi:N-acetylglucosaminyldiphosphoundecaprenol N-acetyl-beta-D-mannosaminyltransferase